MNTPSSATIQSRLYPEVRVTVRRPAYRTRIGYLEQLKNFTEIDPDGFQSQPARVHLDKLRSWNACVEDFEGYTIDGAKPTVADFFLKGDTDLVDDIFTQIMQLVNPPQTDESDERVISAAEGVIAEARARMEKRKNSEPGSTPATSTDRIETAESAKEAARQPGDSGMSATAMEAAPTSSALSSSSDSTSKPADAA